MEARSDGQAGTARHALKRQLGDGCRILHLSHISTSKGGLIIGSVAELTFQALDDLAFAGAAGREVFLDVLPGSYLPVTLGPLIEFLLLASAGALPSIAVQWLRDNQISGFLEAWRNGYPKWLSQDDHLGFIRMTDNAEAWTIDSVGFLMRAQRAGQNISNLPATVPGQMAAAILELAGNIEEHSQAAHTGVIAFRATAGSFEFVVADLGIGILGSLRASPDFTTLDDHGRALELALTDGVSRFNDPLRGHGFRPIFQGLTDLSGYLRFRSGDHALLMDGTKPSLATAHLAQKPTFAGFLASVMCKAC